ASSSAVQVTRLLHGKCSGQLLPADVHVEGIGLNVEEFACRAEATKLAINLNRGCTVGNQHSNRTQSPEISKQHLPPGNIKFRDPIRWKCSDDFNLRHTKITSQLHGHLSRILFHRNSNSLGSMGLLGRFHWLPFVTARSSVTKLTCFFVA